MLIIPFSLASAEEIDKNVFSNNTTIKEDFSKTNLTYTDYYRKADVNYNKTDLVLITEHYTDEVINNYFYFYNAYEMPNSITDVTFEVNGKKYDAGLILVKADNMSGICKYYSNTGFAYKNDETRNYNVLSYKANDKKEDITFTCVLSQKNRTVTMNFDTYLFVERKEFVTFRLSNLAYDWSINTNNYLDTLRAFARWSMPIAAFIELFTGGYDKYEYAPQVALLNFDLSNKNIDKITGMEIVYDKYLGSTDFYDDKDQAHRADLSTSDKVESYTLDNPKRIDSETLHSLEYSSSTKDYSFKFNIPTLETTVNMANSLKMQESENDKYLQSGTTEDMLSYRWSCLVDLDVWYYYNKNRVGDHVWNKDEQCVRYDYKDLSVLRIDYEIDGVSYIAKVNSGAPIDSDNVTDSPLSNWDYFVKWFRENFPSSLLVIALPILAFILLLVFAPQVLVSILSTIFKAIALIFEYIFKAIFFVISLPFKLISSLFKSDGDK